MKSFKVPRKGDILGLDIEGSEFSERFAAGAHMGGGISLPGVIKSVYVVANPRYASVSSTSVSLSQHELMVTYFSKKFWFQIFIHTDRTHACQVTSTMLQNPVSHFY